MAAQVAPYPHMGVGTAWPSHYHHSHQPPPLTLIPIPNTHHAMATTIQTPGTPLHTSTGPWTSAEDHVLMSARRRGEGWSQIHEKYFPGKSANACRKRYERLIHKQKSDDWDDARLERLAAGYRELREEIWRPLAERTGEKWEHVEKACMAQGTRNLHNLASKRPSRSHTRYPNRNDTHFPTTNDENDDSGIGLPDSSNSRRSSGGGMPGLAHILHQPPY